MNVFPSFILPLVGHFESVFAPSFIQQDARTSSFPPVLSLSFQSSCQQAKSVCVCVPCFFFSYWRIMIEASVSGEPLLCFSLSCFVETTLKWRSLALCQDITLFCICATSNSIQALIVISSSVAPASSCPMSAYLK